MNPTFPRPGPRLGRRALLPLAVPAAPTYFYRAPAFMPAGPAFVLPAEPVLVAPAGANWTTPLLVGGAALAAAAVLGLI